MKGTVPGVREILNFGHTFAHALETLTGYASFQHGEAVVWGMRFALALSKVRRKLSAKGASYDHAAAFLRSNSGAGFALRRGREKYFQAMVTDKKAKNGRVRFVLLKNIGSAVLDSGVEPQHLREAFLSLARKEK